jgi:hypothetical protein
MGLRPAWIQTSLRIRAVWSRSMLFAFSFSICYRVCNRTAWILIRLRGCASWSWSMLVANALGWFCHDAAQMCFKWKCNLNQRSFLWDFFSYLESEWQYDMITIRPYSDVFLKVNLYMNHRLFSIFNHQNAFHINMSNVTVQVNFLLFSKSKITHTTEFLFVLWSIDRCLFLVSTAFTNISNWYLLLFTCFCFRQCFNILSHASPRITFAYMLQSVHFFTFLCT